MFTSWSDKTRNEKCACVKRYPNNFEGVSGCKFAQDGKEWSELETFETFIENCENNVPDSPEPTSLRNEREDSESHVIPYIFWTSFQCLFFFCFPDICVCTIETTNDTFI